MRARVLLCMRMCMCVYIHTKDTHALLCVCVYIYIYALLCVYICMYICKYTQTYARACCFVCVCVCTYICICIHIHTHMCECRQEKTLMLLLQRKLQQGQQWVNCLWICQHACAMSWCDCVSLQEGEDSDALEEDTSTGATVCYAHFDAHFCIHSCACKWPCVHMNTCGMQNGNQHGGGSRKTSAKKAAKEKDVEVCSCTCQYMHMRWAHVLFRVCDVCVYTYIQTYIHTCIHTYIYQQSDAAAVVGHPPRSLPCIRRGGTHAG